ncbi:MAG: chain length determinant protein EpsF [Pseudomonadota bacterium]|nr:chain length determinant protein EpsF [Pseudomonadota bacterium]
MNNQTMTLTVSGLIRILLARWWVVALCVLTFVVAVGSYTLLLPKTYRATTELLVDNQRQDPVSGQNLPSQRLSSYMATQAEVIRSYNVTRKVIQQLELAQRADIQQRYQTATDGEGNFNAWLESFLSARLQVSNGSGNNVLTIAVQSTDPILAAELANGYADAYMETILELRTEPAKRISQWYDQQLAELRNRLRDAQQALSNAQQEHGIVAVDERLDLETQRLQELSTLLVKVQGQRLDNQSRQQPSGGDGSRLSTTALNDPLIKELRAKLAAARAKLTELSTQVGQRHPQYRQAQQEVMTLEEQLDQNLELITGSLRSTTEQSKDFEQQVAAELAAQKQKVLQLNRTRDELSLLKQELDNAQSAYNAALDRASHTQLESRLALLSEVAVLNIAHPPSLPSSPRLGFNLVLAFCSGLLIGLGLALVWEWLDQRVRSGADVERRLGVPVLATIPGPTGGWSHQRGGAT